MFFINIFSGLVEKPSGLPHQKFIVRDFSGNDEQ